MAIEDFAECYATKVGTTVDLVVDFWRQFGDEKLRQLLSWYRSLSPQSISAISFFAGSFSDVLKKILKNVIGIEAAEALVLFSGAAAWTTLISACLECEERL
ncbi:hypothetical protein LJR251_005924 [Rhizobium rhizogenes]|uniref:hypothetical protein n=1 Tax=Rhizobium rhizogenes TaxID=359 RepID=UPI003ED165AC